jgi:hypothetical protein
MVIFPSAISLSFPSGALPYRRLALRHSRTVAPRLARPLAARFGITAQLLSRLLAPATVRKEKKRATFFVY